MTITVAPPEAEATEAPAASRRAARPVRLPRPLGFGLPFWLAAGWLALVVGAALWSLWLPTKDPNALDLPNKLVGPFSDGALLGTDGLGRDMLARVMAGARVSLTVGVGAVAVGLVVGGMIGVIAGYARGSVDTLVVAGIDVMLAFPSIVVLLALASVLDQSVMNITVVVGVLSIPIYARVARANTLMVAGREYVMAARTLGARPMRIVLREIVPAVFPPLAAFALTAVGIVIIAEGTLAFLGLSVKPPAATWGSMIAEGRQFDETNPHVVMVPSLVLFLTVLAFNFVGEEVRKRVSGREAAV